MLEANQLVEAKADEANKLIEEYLATFDEKHQLAYKIAQEHLQSSFCLEKRIGFNISNFIKKII